MPTLKIEGVPPLDGDYDLDITTFTNRELHIIKQESGVRAGELEEAFSAGDNDLLVAITLIILRRAEKGEPAQLRDMIWDAAAGAVQIDLTDAEKAEEDEQVVPPASEPEETSEPVTSPDPSGSDSPSDSDPLANGRSRIGIQV
jgi:hypothetical protein